MSTTSVYIIISGEFTKIGFAADPKKRVKELRVGAPQGADIYHTREFATVEAARYVEKRMHRQLGHLRNSGEWFRYSPLAAKRMLNGIKVPPDEHLTGKGGYGWRDPSMDEIRDALNRTFPTEKVLDLPLNRNGK